MDADVEMVTRGGHYDSDEVYPVDDLQTDTVHEPHVKRQNRFFLVGILTLFMSVAIYLVARIYLSPDEVMAGEMMDGNYAGQGTVINGADNAKMTEALQKAKKMNKPGHASSFWSGGQTVQPAAEEAADNSGIGPHDMDYSGWNARTVTLADGPLFEIVDTLEHDPKSFTEGLTFSNGQLYESIGLNRHSALLVLDPTTGGALQTIPMEGKYFGEGLTVVDSRLIQLTYKAKTGFVYDMNDLQVPPTPFTYDTTTGEGWGLTYNPHKNELIVSDGSEYLHFWDATTFEFKRKLAVKRQSGAPALEINELEWWRDRVVSNVWYKDILLVINPDSGECEKEYDFSTIWQAAGLAKNRRADVFNGISICDDPDALLVTGKNWDHMFKIKLLLPSETL